MPRVLKLVRVLALVQQPEPQVLLVLDLPLEQSLQVLQQWQLALQALNLVLKLGQEALLEPLLVPA